MLDRLHETGALYAINAVLYLAVGYLTATVIVMF